MVLASYPDLTLRVYNDACREILGVMDEPSQLGRNLFEIDQSWQDLTLSDEDVPIAELPLALAFQGHWTLGAEYKVRRKDGTVGSIG